MKEIPDKSVDMILCDLPYGTTACKRDTIIPFEPLWEHYKRIIKDNGAIVLTASQPFTSALVMSNPDMFKYELIWEKEKITNFMLVKKQFGKIHENICVFYKQQPVYNPQKVPVSQNKIDKRKNFNQVIKKAGVIPEMIWGHFNKDDWTRFPDSVLYFSRERTSLHPTQKPVALFEYLIKTYTNEGDLVLDNCAGSWTTWLACKNLNRNFILIEQLQEYVDIANKRLETTTTSLF
jgi:site-specific DNA-methyltransferase (adenine-specific)